MDHTMIKTLFSLNSLSIGNGDNYECFIKYLQKSKKIIKSRLWFIFGLVILYGIIGLFVQITPFYNWAAITTGIIGCVITPIMFVYLYKIISSWNNKINNGFSKFGRQCMNLAMKNYRLLKEYREIYHFHHGDLLEQCSEKYKDGQLNVCKNDNDIAKYVRYVLENDTCNKMEGYEWIHSIINKVYYYIQLCYYLSFIGPDDELELKQNTIYINIETDSIMNKKNRKLEKFINQLPIEYKYELMNAWTYTDRHNSERILTMIPCKWIMYEYRNLFRYLLCAKYFKHIYSAFDKDNTEIENIIFDICDSIKEIFKTSTKIFPVPFINLFNVLANLFIIVLDNLVALSIVVSIHESWIFSVGSSLLMYGIILSVINGFIGTINDINMTLDPWIGLQDIQILDSEFETVFNEMKTITFDGKTKN